MKRRNFITLVGSVACGWSLVAHAQHPGKRPTIGFLAPSTASADGGRIAAFEQRLSELGWISGVGIAIDVQWAEGKTERFREIAAKLVYRKVDVIVTWGTATALAVKESTSSIPIVFTIVGDPVGSGLVASLARPGGNVTGLSTQNADSAGKRLGLLRELVSDLRLLAIMANAGNPGPVQEMREVDAIARRLDVEVIRMDIRRVEDIALAFEAINGKAQALYVTGDAMFNAHRAHINTLTLAARLPSVHGFREIVAAGGLMSYGANYVDLFRRAGDYVDKILRGAKPGDIPVDQPTKFELVINLKTPKALGLTIPPSLLARADEVIE